WVREFGIDGFRVDTAKHVSKETWGLLKEESNRALQEWRNSTSPSDDPAALWSDNFWMTGEHWGFKTDPTDGSSYATTGGFDSMLNFSF
ncbi:alpha-amylase, partial [Vibrio vulnificus]